MRQSDATKWRELMALAVDYAETARSRAHGDELVESYAGLLRIEYESGFPQRG